MANQLRGIFGMIGAPKVMQSTTVHRPLLEESLSNLNLIWPQLKVLHSPSPSHHRVKMDAHIKKVKEWLETSKGEDGWLRQLPIMQLALNTQTQRIAGSDEMISPYKRVFNIDPPIPLQIDYDPIRLQQLTSSYEVC